MSIMRVQDVSDDRSANRYQDRERYDRDSYEKNIEKEITNLEEQMNSITSDSRLSDSEKVSEKKKLQEKIQNLDSQLKRYQVQKHQEEKATKKEAAESDNAAKRPERQSGAQTAQESRTGAETEIAAQQTVSGRNAAQDQTVSEDEQAGLSDVETGVIISISNTRDQINYMHKIKTNLEGRMLTAQTEEEKRALQERINNVSLTMGQKIKKIAEAVEKNQISEEERKDKIAKLQQEEEEARKARRNVVLPDGGKSVSAEQARGRENFVIKGKVSIS